MHFSALSRQSRDLIALTVRVFHARKHISTAYVLNAVFNNPINHGITRVDMLNNGQISTDYAVDAGGLDLSLYCDRLRSELIRQLDQRVKMESNLTKV